MADAEFECRSCGKPVKLEKYKGISFCPTCGTAFKLKPQPLHWLFQFNPSSYKWFDRIEETDEPEQWLVTHYIKLIHKGDLVAIWSSGRKAGVYALGKVTTAPEKNPLSDSQRRYFLNKLDVDKFQDKYSAFVEYSKIFLAKPLLQEACGRDSVLVNMQIFTNPQSTNFRLTTEQWNRIMELLGKNE